MNKNYKRKDKFFPMNNEEFQKCVMFALRNGDRKVSYCKSKNGVYYGGMADSFEEALNYCKKFYEGDNDCELYIGDFTESTTIWQTEDILHEIGALLDKEYDKYIDNLKIEE